MTSLDNTERTHPGRRTQLLRALGLALCWVVGAASAILLLTSLLVAALGNRELLGNLMTLALPAFLAEALSALSPCSLPILLGFFSIAFRNEQSRIAPVTVAFLIGAGTTMAVLGAGFTAIGSLAIEHQDTLMTVGGVLIVLFGLLTLSGRGFGGVHVNHKAGTSPRAAYVFGLLFALGWSACVGPILGSILTLLVTSGGSADQLGSILAGAGLALIYVVGLGLPILVLVFGLTDGLAARDIAQSVRGRTLNIGFGSRQWETPMTTVISGLMMIGLGWLLLNGSMMRITEQFGSSWLARWVVKLEELIPH